MVRAAFNSLAQLDFSPGARFKITGFLSDVLPTYRHRLISMGFLPGQTLQVIRVAPLGDPVLVLIQGTQVALRQHEVQSLYLQELPSHGE